MTAWAHQFPAIAQLQREGKVYLDSAATTQLPQSVIDAMTHYMQAPMANVHRAQHSLGTACTEAFETARKKLSDWFGVGADDMLIWTRGTTEAINLVAFGWAKRHIKAGEEIVVSLAEHHANFVPWQQLQRYGVKVIYCPLTTDGQICLDDLEACLTPKTRLVALHFASNVTGIIQPINEISALVRANGAKILIDAAQVSAHLQFSFSQLDVDFVALSAHKMYGPTGIGALLSKTELVEEMDPVMFGGEMVDRVTLDDIQFAPAPLRFEAGTPNIIGAIGWHAAVQWLTSQDLKAIRTHEHQLTQRLLHGLKSIPGLRLLGEPRLPRVPLLSFVIDGIHPYDVAALLDEQGVMVRAGQHCAHPLYEKWHLPGAVRISIGVYNTENDIDQCLNAIEYALDLLQ